MSEKAPMPSASVERPMSAVKAPQTMNRRPTKSTLEAMRLAGLGLKVLVLQRRAKGSGLTAQSSSGRRTNGDAKLDANRAGVRSGDSKAELRAVHDSGRY